MGARFFLQKKFKIQNSEFKITRSKSSFPPRGSAKSKQTLRGRTLRISNSGATPLDADHIFERFYQGSCKKGSTGLGLALVAAVCRHYGFALRYYFEDGKHHFEVGF